MPGRRIRPQNDHGHLRARGPGPPSWVLTDCADRRVRPIGPRKPLMLAPSLPERAMLAAWWLQGFAAVAVVTAVVVSVLAGRAVARASAARAAAERRSRAQAEELTRALDMRAEADAALRASEAQFQSIMRHAPMMVALKDLQGRYTFVNEAFRAYTGRAEVVIGKTAADFYPRQLADFIAREDREAVESRRVIQREMTPQLTDDARTALLVKFPVFDARGEPTGVGLVVTDVTEQKKIEAQLAQAQRIESLGQLTGGIAHDFNNLLTSILLNADVLAGALGDDKLRPLAEAMRVAAERGAELTRQLLAFGRRQMLEPRPTDLRELLTGMEGLMRRTIGEHIRIEFHNAAGLWFATIDPGQLEHAMLNLVLNARDAMPDGGRLTIETANCVFDADQAWPEINPGQYVMIAVGDSGVGMTPDALARAFEPFFTTKDVGKGTGLGPSMVYGFVKQSGGHARIQSEVGSGTVVRLYLPRAIVAEAAASAAPQTGTELPSGKETILFVEDDPMVRQYTGQHIVGLGYNVITAENAVEALALVESGAAPDLLFTDVVMPGGMNGRQLALKLRQRWPNLRVLYTSGYAHGQLTIDLVGAVEMRAEQAVPARGARRQTARCARRCGRERRLDQI